MITLRPAHERGHANHGWLDAHPLGREMVEQERQWQSYIHWPLQVAGVGLPDSL